jgi:hypothetical protein
MPEILTRLLDIANHLHKKSGSSSTVPRLGYRMLLGVLGGVALIVLCGPALIAFGIAGATSWHRDLMITIGVIWLLLGLLLILVAMITIVIIGIQRAVYKRRVTEQDPRIQKPL